MPVDGDLLLRVYLLQDPQNVRDSRVLSLASTVDLKWLLQLQCLLGKLGKPGLLHGQGKRTGLVNAWSCRRNKWKSIQGMNGIHYKE